MKKSIYNNIILYTLWVNGRSADDVDQQFPIDCNVNDTHIWHSDFKKAYKDFYSVKINDADNPNGYYTEIYQDYIVVLYSIDIDIDKFEAEYELKFDLNDERVQDCLPYFVNYNFNTVAERIQKFKNK